MSNWSGGRTQAEAREVHAREEARQERAERAEAEGWDGAWQEDDRMVPRLNLPRAKKRVVLHTPGDPFCECETCNLTRGDK